MAEALGGAEADAHSGEGAGAVDDGDGVERVQGDASLRSEGVDGRDETLGGGATGEGCNGERAGGVGEGDAAGCATGVDEQNLQMVRPPVAGWDGFGEVDWRFSVGGYTPPPKISKIFKKCYSDLDTRYETGLDRPDKTFIPKRLFCSIYKMISLLIYR